VKNNFASLKIFLSIFPYHQGRIQDFKLGEAHLK